MRAFIGFPIPPYLAETLYSSFADQRAAFPEIKWVTPGNYHITILFLGEIDEAEAVRVGRILDGLSFIGGVRAAFGRVAAFPPRGALKVLHVGLAEGEEYCKGIHAKISGVLPEYAEKRRYTPHVTLGRVRRGGAVSWTEPAGSPPKDSFAIEEIVLFQSILSASGPVYERIHSTTL